MSEELNLLHVSWTGALTGVATFFAFVGQRFVTKVDKIEKSLINHEKEDIGKYATTEQLTRVYVHIDDSVRTTNEGLRDLRGDISEIKTLLINGAHK